MQIEKLSVLPEGIILDRQNLMRAVCRPLGLLTGKAAAEAVSEGRARPLAGGQTAFTYGELFLACEDGAIRAATASFADIQSWAKSSAPDVNGAVTMALASLSEPRRRFAGIDMSAPVVMGILNVTPDSFYAGSRLASPQDAIAAGLAMVEAGTGIIDIGGESTRPGSTAPGEQEELDRVLPVIEGLAGCGAVLSIDTRRPSVMRAAVAAGAGIINDVSALSAPGAIDAAVELGVSVVLMHCQGDPATMQDDPRYDHAPYEILGYLASRAATCEAAGIKSDRIAIDPGFGFGKTAGHNQQILDSLGLFQSLGYPVLAGLSRKGFLGVMSGTDTADDRLAATIAATILAAGQGAQIHRVHDPREVRQALSVWQSMASA